MFGEPAIPAAPARDDEDSGYYTTGGVARLCNKSPSTVLWWVKTGKLRSIKLPGGQNIYERAEVERLRKK